MANQTALIIVAGRTQRITSADTLAVGDGIVALGNTNLTLNPGGTATDVIIAVNANLVGGTGTGSVNFGSMTGTLSTPTGAATHNGSASTFTNILYANGNIDRSAAGNLLIGATNATAVRLGSPTIPTRVMGDFQVDGNEIIVGTATFDDNVTFGDGVGTDTVTFRSTINGFAGAPIDPSTDNTVEFGSSALRYAEMNSTQFIARADATNTSFSTLTATGLTGTASGTFAVVAGASQALTLTGNAASTWSTSAGALTLTSAAAATWSTAAGALTVNGTGGVNLQGGGTTALAVNATGTTLIIQAGTTLSVTGTGTINLPKNATSTFQIEGSAVANTAALTAANFDKLFDGSTVTTHTHSAGSATNVTITGLTTTGLVAGDAAYVSANNTLTKTIATVAASSVFFGVVSAAGAAKVAGVATTACTAGGAPGPGVPVYLSVGTAGVVTAVAPSTAGQFVAEVGVCLDNTNYPTTIEMLISPKTVVGI